MSGIGNKMVLGDFIVKCDDCGRIVSEKKAVFITILFYCPACFAKLEKEFKEIEKELKNTENK